MARIPCVDGAVLLPDYIRAYLNLLPGDPVWIGVRGDELIVRPLPGARAQRQRRIQPLREQREGAD